VLFFHYREYFIYSFYEKKFRVRDGALVQDREDFRALRALTKVLLFTFTSLQEH
jgi:hypothetical protein